MRELERELNESTDRKLSPIIQLHTEGAELKRSRLRNAVTLITVKDHNRVIPRYCLLNQLHLITICP